MYQIIAREMQLRHTQHYGRTVRGESTYNKSLLSKVIDPESSPLWNGRKAMVQTLPGFRAKGSTL